MEIDPDLTQPAPMVSLPRTQEGPIMTKSKPSQSLKEADRRRIAMRMAKRYSVGVYVVVDTKNARVRAGGEAFHEAKDAASAASEYGKNHEVFRLSTKDGAPTLRGI